VRTGHARLCDQFRGQRHTHVTQRVVGFCPAPHSDSTWPCCVGILESRDARRQTYLAEHLVPERRTKESVCSAVEDRARRVHSLAPTTQPPQHLHVLFGVHISSSHTTTAELQLHGHGSYTVRRLQPPTSSHVAHVARFPNNGAPAGHAQGLLDIFGGKRQELCSGNVWFLVETER
jgi:hypothetical protein